ncbi:MAG: hypothetical protein FJ041_05755, partial [Candidatus Cloacimonetes bacterium]|nr:hypothetical protein [Candidatus Cloacimonadota bacterium]
MRKVFFVILPVMVLLLCSGLMAVDIVVGNGNQQAPRPIDLGWRFSLFQTLYYPSELNQGGYINSISFYSTMQAAMPQVGIQLYLGVTSVDDLSGGWIPASQLTQVYSGTYNFVAGYNQMQLNLSTPFLYSGGNLVLMAKMPQNLYFSQSQMFNCQTVGSTRARFVHSDTQDYNPNIPPTPTAGQLSGLFPKTMFSFSDVPLQHDIAVVSLSVNPPYILGIMTNFNVSYTNLGSSSEADYTIKIYNSLQQEVASVTGAPILPNQTLNAVISWTPVAEGYHEFTAKILLNGDMNPFNNVSLPVTVMVTNPTIPDYPITTGQYRVPIDFYWRSTLFEMVLTQQMAQGL